MHHPRSSVFTFALLLQLGFLGVLGSACHSISSSSQPLRENRLALSDSPYLRQHATNPVDWYPWCDEALRLAKEEDKLLVISIGYSACHWCHVMEKESFSDTAVARFMNEHFVSIKVDREQRPDLDQLYQQAAILTSGRGGWPLNVIAFPDGSPVIAATYFSRENWMELLPKIQALHAKSPEQLQSMASRIVMGVGEMGRSPFAAKPDILEASTPRDAAHSILPELDPRWGGLKGSTKFPMPGMMDFLLAYGHTQQDSQALTAVSVALDQMAKGGIYDHVGGGFFRYATDSIWHIPHFEKMLYDNAQLVALYSRAYRAGGQEHYRQVVRETIAFLQRELSDPAGALYASLDADSEGEEGGYYVWSEKDFLKTLGMKGKAFKDYFHVLPQGNWQEKQSVLMVIEDPAVIAQRHGYTEAEFTYMIPVAKQLLLEKREKRTRPHIDKKILTSWNALMITGYVEAYRAFGDDSLLHAATTIADFLLKHMKREGGGLYRSYFDGKAGTVAFADDYSFLIEALIDLYQVTFNETWILEAETLMAFLQANFKEESSPYFYLTQDSTSLIARPKGFEDNVIPSINASLAKGLFLLGTYLDRPDYLKQSREMIGHLEAQVRSSGGSFYHWASLSLWFAKPPYDVAIVGENWSSLAKEWWMRYDPNVLLLGGKSEGRLPLLQRKLVPGTTMIYVCQDKVCQLPVTDNAAALAQIK